MVRHALEEDCDEERLLELSFADLAEDFDDLAFVARAASERLIQAVTELEAARDHLYRATFRSVYDKLDGLRGELARILDDLRLLTVHARRAPMTPAALDGLSRMRDGNADLLRALGVVVAALVTATDWQSPPFAHSLLSGAGRQTGRVTAYVDDYKRDRHAEATAFEEAYLRELVVRPDGARLTACMTGSGMAAFTTVLSFLVHERALERSVLVGRGLYHECKDLLRGALGGRVHEVSELDTDEILATVRSRRPGALFLDSLCNARGLALPDLPRLLAGVAREAEEPISVVLDNTARSVSFQPFPLVCGRSPRLRVLVFESLLKHAQYGLDRTNAGMVVAWGSNVERLADHREHLGANVPDVAAVAIPPPDRARLERRLARFDRNAGILASRLERHLARRRRRIVTRVVYPGLASHPSYRLARGLLFRGSFFALELDGGRDPAQRAHRFVDLAIETARARAVRLLAGASFGFDATRLYVVATRSESADAFLRVSVGTEHRLGVERLAWVLAEAVDRLEESTTSSRSEDAFRGRRTSPPGRRPRARSST